MVEGTQQLAVVYVPCSMGLVHALALPRLVLTKAIGLGVQCGNSAALFLE